MRPNEEMAVRIERWRVDVRGDDDEPVLVGLVDGQPHVSPPLLELHVWDGYAWTKGGVAYLLGAPDPTVERPASLPPDAQARKRARAEAALARIRAGLSPTAAELANAPELDFWAVLPAGSSHILVGYVTGHPRLRDGSFISTSQLIWMSQDRKAARTISRFYRLGAPLGAAPPPDES